MTDPAMVTAAVARNLRALRTGRGWSLDALASRSGVSKGVLVAIEQSRGNPSIATLCRISDAFGVALVRLVEVDDAPPVRVVPPDRVVPLWRGGPGSTGTLLVGSDPPQHLEMWEWRMTRGDGYDGEAHPAGTREVRVGAGGRAHPGRRRRAGAGADRRRRRLPGRPAAPLRQRGRAGPPLRHGRHPATHRPA